MHLYEKNLKDLRKLNLENNIHNIIKSNLEQALIEKVKEKKQPVTLEPMNPFERMIVHSFVSTFEGVYSKSIGNKPRRSVVIYPESKNTLV